jgi:hypothetical protein
MKGISRKLTLLLAIASFATATVSFSAYAQNDSSSSTGDAAAQQPASGAKTTKAQRKAARKQARAKRTAELKKLEANGYKPSQDDPSYPQNLQNAQKKAGIGQGASQ